MNHPGAVPWQGAQMQPGMPRQNPEGIMRSNYDANSRKGSYAQPMHQGDEYRSYAPNGMQMMGNPAMGAANPQRMNSNMPQEGPGYGRPMMNSNYTFNADHGSFANDAQRNGGTRRSMSRNGSLMLGGGNGSMYGMSGGMGSMYGGMRSNQMGSMYGMGMSRPASLFGSNYGSQYGMGTRPASMYRAGSLYGMGAPVSRMGSMYSMGGAMGSMMAPMGTMGSTYGSMYGGMNSSMRGGMNSSMRGGMNGSMRGGMNGGSQYGFNRYGSAYGGVATSQQNGSSNYGTNGVGLGATGVDRAGETNAAAASPAGPPASSTGTPCVLVVSAGANPSVPVMLPSNPPTPMGPGEVLRASPNISITAEALTRSPLCQNIYSSVSAGHNAALLLATDGSNDARALSTEVVRRVLNEALGTAQKAAAGHGEAGYYDARVSICALRNGSEVVDCVEGGFKKAAEVGSHPVFGPALLNVGAIMVRDTAAHMPVVSSAITAASVTLGAKVIVIGVIVKQVRPSQKGGDPTEVLLSSVLFLVSNNPTGPHSFFQAFRSDETIPVALTKGCLGGACRTAAVLCLPNCADASSATDAMRSLLTIRNITNTAPRSGNLARFITFATAESDKLRKKPDTDAAMLQRVVTMLNDGRALLADPRNAVPVAYPSSWHRNASQPANNPPRASQNHHTNAHVNTHANTHAHDEDAAAEKSREASNPMRIAIVASPEANNGLPPTFSVGPDEKSIVDSATGKTAAVQEVVTRAPEDWRTTTSDQVYELQTLFQNGNNTAVIGTVSPNGVNPLDKQPLWLSYKRMVSSILSVASQKYKLAEVSLSVTLVGGNEVLADLLVGTDAGAQAPQKLAVAYSPLFGPTVYKATIIKQPTALQIESTINSALYQVPVIMQKYPDKNTVIVASAVMKGVTESDVFTSSMLAASAMDPTVFTDILDKKPDSPHELFEYAFGGPCCTLFLGDIIQGDSNMTKLVELLNRLGGMQNRSVRTCSVRKFIAFAADSLKKADAKAAAAPSAAERDAILRSKKSMEVFYKEYKLLIEDSAHHDPKTYRRSGGGPVASSPSAVPGGAPGSSAPPPDNSGRLGGESGQDTAGERSYRPTNGEQPSSRQNGARDAGGRPSGSRPGAPGDENNHRTGSSSNMGRDGEGRSSSSRPSSGHHRDSTDERNRRPGSSSSSKRDGEGRSSSNRPSSGHHRSSSSGSHRKR